MARKFYKQDIEVAPSIEFSNSQPEGFTLVEDYNERKALYKKRYDKLKCDGLDYFNGFQAELYISILDGDNQASDVLAIQSHLKLISEELKEGSWLTAKLTLPNIPLSGIFDQEMKDKVQLDLDTYVSNNY